MMHLSEQVQLAELETYQVIIKSHGQHTYLEETMKSTQHVFYAKTSLSSQVYVANIIYFHVFMRVQGKTLNFCELKLCHKNSPTPLTLMSWHNYAIFSKYFILRGALNVGV